MRMLSLFVLIGSCAAAAFAGDIETPFGVYPDHATTVSPAVRELADDDEFSNVDFYGISFTSEELDLLKQNLFVVRGPLTHRMLVAQDYTYQQIPMLFHDLYSKLCRNGLPIYVTTDAMLHTFHALYDHILKTIEINQFTGLLSELTDGLYDQTLTMYDAAGSDDAQNALRLNLAYLSVAKSLLDPSFTPPETVADLVETELIYITAHNGTARSPILKHPPEDSVPLTLDNCIDYTQFIVRGHYVGNPDLERYFAAMMWYSHARLRAEIPYEGEVFRRKEADETLQALYLVQALCTMETSLGTGVDIWGADRRRRLVFCR